MTADLYAGSRHTVCVGWYAGMVKVMQVQFGRDGSIFVHAPYHPSSQGLLSRVLLPPNSETIHMKPGGAATTEHVKYSHHPDGRCHFSQDGKIRTEIINQSARLADDVDHMFSVDAQGFEHFERLTDYKGGSNGRHLLDFSGGEPDALHLVARWKKVSRDQVLAGGRSGIYARGADGRVRGMLAFRPPKGSPYAEHLMAIECQRRDPLALGGEFGFLLYGGFGREAGIPAAESSALVMMYPATNVEDLPTVDLRVAS